MTGSRLVSSLFAATLVAVPAAAQTPARVDFARDVQPIFATHCVGCHGPSQQMNGFRLDRRAEAMRGGTFPVITPGTSAGSRLYLKLLGGQFGQQMPPAGALGSREIEVIKNWLDQGADWPDEHAGARPPAHVVPASTRLMRALRQGDVETFRRELTRGGREAASGIGEAGGWTPLMYAALYADDDAVRRLIAAGADPSVATDGGTTALLVGLHDAAITRELIRAGADVNHRPSDGRTPLIVAAARVGAAPVVRLLLEAGADPKAMTAVRTTALRQAALAGQADTMRLLIAAGTDPQIDAAATLVSALNAGCLACADLVVAAVDRRGLGAALINTSRFGDVATARYLLDHGADPRASDGAGRTALMAAAHSDSYPVALVQALLRSGADANTRTLSGETALAVAARRGGPLADLLAGAGATSDGVSPFGAPSDPRPVAASSPRAAIGRALPLLQAADAVFLQKSGCVSCHHDSLTAHTVSMAKAVGLAVDESAVDAHRARLSPFLAGWRDSTLRGFGIPGNQDTVGYVLYGLIGAGLPPDASTDALAYYMKGLQQPDGSWRVSTSRPPIESSDIEVTAVALRAIQRYAPPARLAEYTAATAAATTWLAAAVPSSTEDRSFQLLGLAWGRGDRALRRRLMRDLVAEQRPDGGWAPIARTAMASDAYATGQALVSLAEADPGAVRTEAYNKGVAYLLRTQLADGSWYVHTRALPAQAYFETGFPHGRDQFISAAATNWATQALIRALAPR